MNIVTNNNSQDKNKKFALWIYNRYHNDYRNGFILYLITQMIILYVDYINLLNKFFEILLLKSILCFLPLILIIAINKTKIYKSKFVLYNSIANLLPTFASIIIHLYFLEYYNSLSSIYFSIFILQIVFLGLFIYRWKITLINSLLILIFFTILHLIIYPDYTFFKIPYLPFLYLVILTTTLISYYYQEIKEKMFNTEIKLTQERNQILNQNNTLKQLNELKNTLFSIIGHDLKSPISGINNLLQLTIDEFDELSKKELKEYLLAIKHTSDNVYQLLENILFWGNVQNENYLLNKEKISLPNLINDIISLSHIQANEKNINITIETQNNLEINTDKFILSTILRNILSNSIKFTPNNGLIKIRYFEKNDKIQIEIEDSGIGMDEKFLTTIFDANKDKLRLGTNNETGTGLGLIITRDFLKKIDGLLTFKSQPNIGTTATIYIPKIILN